VKSFRDVQVVASGIAALYALVRQEYEMPVAAGTNAEQPSAVEEMHNRNSGTAVAAALLLVKYLIARFAAQNV